MEKEFINTPRTKKICGILILIFVIVAFLIAIGVYNVKLSINRYVYNTEAEMLNDLQGIWVNYFPDTRTIGSSYYMFNNDYTMVQTDYDDNGDVEYTNTWTYTLKPEKGLIFFNGKECDLYNYDGEQYFRQYITTDEPTMLWKKVD